MDWFKQNPFLGTVALAAALVLGIGAYFVYSEAARHGMEQEAFNQNKLKLEGLRRNKPFPNEANVKATEDEKAQAVKLLEEIAKELQVEQRDLTPQAFQDELSKAVQEVTRLAADKGVVLPEGFYLGFETYETQPPSPEAAAQLGQQLRSIRGVVSAILDARVKSLDQIIRTPLPSEAGAPDAAQKEPAAALALAPFDLRFTADQSSFRLAFNRIPELEPPVFVRLLAIANSAPTPPLKNAAAEDKPPAGEGQPAEQGDGIQAVLGRETLLIDLRLASVIAQPPSP